MNEYFADKLLTLWLEECLNTQYLVAQINSRNESDHFSVCLLQQLFKKIDLKYIIYMNCILHHLVGTLQDMFYNVESKICVYDKQIDN